METNKQTFKKTEPLSVVVERLKTMNGESLSGSDFAISETRISSNEFLLQYPRGTYTAARTVNRTAIMDLQGHIKRTCDSLKLVKFKNSENISIEGNQDETNNNDSEETEPDYVTQAMAPYRDPEIFKGLVIPLLKTGLTKYFEIEEETPWHIKGVGEIKVTWIVCYSFKESRPILAIYFTPLHAPSSSKCRTKQGFSFKLGRGLWGTQKNSRRIVKILMHNPDTRLPIVVTAPLHFVLEGTIRKIVTMICERDGIDLKSWFPNLDDVVHWEGAFITSTSRLVLPIELIHCRDGRVTYTASRSIECCF
ncbi:hypothetical protein C2G38_2218111 [Gigaspora rosea]|uniref:Uncharacterized protein n=1 Tax=Gigaspora rosea TaxID=44941 RepID=A0A397U6V3_9GLOM|nr:hypothetical protein C2G38_2218111 [Gigaspora rosea]